MAFIAIVALAKGKPSKGQRILEKCYGCYRWLMAELSQSTWRKERTLSLLLANGFFPHLMVEWLSVYGETAYVVRVGECVCGMFLWYL